jgi:hypothetical protein
MLKMNGKLHGRIGGRGTVGNMGWDLQGREESISPTAAVSRIKSWNRSHATGHRPPTATSSTTAQLDRQVVDALRANKTPVVPAAFETDVGKRGSSHPRPSATRRRK